MGVFHNVDFNNWNHLKPTLRNRLRWSSHVRSLSISNRILCVSKFLDVSEKWAKISRGLLFAALCTSERRICVYFIFTFDLSLTSFLFYTVSLSFILSFLYSELISYYIMFYASTFVACFDTLVYWLSTVRNTIMAIVVPMPKIKSCAL